MNLIINFKKISYQQNNNESIIKKIGEIKFRKKAEEIEDLGEKSLGSDEVTLTW